MKINYIATDLGFESEQDLNMIVKELGNEVIPHFNERVDEIYRVYLGGSFYYGHPEETVEKYCKLIEGLSEKSNELWKTCTHRFLDIAFESGTEPNSSTYLLPANLIERVSKLGIGIAVTIYPVGSYSSNKDNGETEPGSA